MIEIKEKLLKFNLILEKEDFNFNLILNIIKKITKIKLKKEDIIIKNNILYLKIKPIYKNEIFLNKDRIIKELNENLNKNKIEKII